MFVPAVPSAIGSGATLDEALAAARKKLAVMIQEMLSRMEPVPAQQGSEVVEEAGRAWAAKGFAGIKVEFIDIVSVMVSRLRVPCLRGKPSSHFRS